MTTTSNSSEIDPIWWVVLGLVVVLVIVGIILFVRSRRRSRSLSLWRTERAALGSETWTVVEAKLLPVLADATAHSRAMAWPPVEAELVGLADRWGKLLPAAPSEQRAAIDTVHRQLQDLIVAVRAENDALFQGMAWTALRPRIDQDRASIINLVRPAPPAGATPQSGLQR